MNAVVETTERETTYTITSHRVTLNLDEAEAVIVKTALEYLRSPVGFTEEAATVRGYDSEELFGIISLLETAGVYTDGVYTT